MSIRFQGYILINPPKDADIQNETAIKSHEKDEHIIEG